MKWRETNIYLSTGVLVEDDTDQSNGDYCKKKNNVIVPKKLKLFNLISFTETTDKDETLIFIIITTVAVY